MSEMLGVSGFIAAFGALSYALISVQDWWGFWRPDRRAARQFARERSRRIAALVALGIPPTQAVTEVDRAIAAEATRTLALVREVA